MDMIVHLQFNNDFTWFNDDYGTLVLHFYFNISIIF
jgi:hypothetical protein